MYKNFGSTLCLILVLASLTGCGKKTYEECVLEHAKELISKEAVRAIEDACFEKYYEPTKFDPSTAKCLELRELSHLELQLLDGRGDINNGYFHGTIYNGNNSVTIEELTIGIKYNAHKEPTPEIVNPFEKYSYKQFNTEVKISPNTASDFSVKVLPKSSQYEKIIWNISSAKTCK
jgi:hypothetical protein